LRTIVRLSYEILRITPLVFFQGLDLRVEHTHGYNIEKGQGGHYHYDTTPDIIEYVGYFNLAESEIKSKFLSHGR